MRDAGVTRPFTGALERWRYAPVDDTARAAAEIRRRLATRPPMRRLRMSRRLFFSVASC